MKYSLSLIFLLTALSCFAQDVKKQEHILYIVDSIPLIKEPDKNSGAITTNDIDHVEVITDADKIKTLGYNAVDKVIYVTTKEFVKRPDSIKEIPTTRLMDRNGEIWFLKNARIPYTGKFIDYFLNGKIQGEGTLKNGVVDGIRTVYYENGNKNFFRNYVNGVTNGYSEEYFPNGKLKQKGTFKSGQDDGLWVEYYSTGEIKRQTNFSNMAPVMSKDEKNFFNLLRKSTELTSGEDYKGAIAKLNEAEKLNNKYADLYFFKGTAELENYDFDKAVIDFDKAIELEPFYMEALANRAFARIRKYEFKDGRTISKTSEVTILAAKDKVDIPADEKAKICNDLNKSVELGDDKEMIFDAIKNYCSAP